MNIKLSLLFVAAAFCVMRSEALVEREWIGPDGGKWSVPSNWKDNTVPSEDEGAAFKGGTVVLDADVSVARIVFQRGSESRRFETKIVGAGHKLSTKSVGSFSYVWEYHKATLDGVAVTSGANGKLRVFGSLDVVNDASLSIYEVDVEHNAKDYPNYPKGCATFGGGTHSITILQALNSGTKVVINDGKFPLVTGSWFYSCDGAEFELNGGVLTAPIDVKSGGSLLISGGVWAPRTAPYVREGSHIAVTGGKVEFSYETKININDGSVVRLVDAMTENAVLESKNVHISIVSNNTLNVLGTLIVSNQYFNTWGTSKITGGGNIYANRISLHDNDNFDTASTIAFEDNPRLCLGIGLFFGKNRSSYVFPEGVRIGSMGDWAFPVGSPEGKTHFGGELKIDTSDIYGGNPHSVVCSNLCARYGATVSVLGGGDAVLHFADEGRLHSFAIEAGNTVALNSFARAGSFTLGDGAKLKLAAGVSALEIGDCVFGDGATVEVAVSGAFYDVQPVLIPASASVNLSECLSKIALTGDGASSAELKSLNGSIVVVCSRNNNYDYSSQWNGAAGDGKWNTAGNWARGVPAKWAELFFVGKYHEAEVVTNGVAALMHNGLNFLDGLAPFVLKSKTVFEVADDGYGAFQRGISSKSDSPVIIDANVRIHSNLNNPKYTLALVSTGRSYMQINGNVRRETENGQEFLLRPMGDIRFGGKVVCSNVMFSATTGTQRYSAVTVLDGSDMEVRTQCSNLVEKGVFRVSDGGSLSIAGSRYRWAVENDFPHEIDGTMTLAAPIASLGRQTYTGGGSLSVGAVKSDANGAGELELAGNLQFTQSADWTTVTTDSPCNPITLRVSGTPTITAASDWTYGPGVENSATDSIARSLFVTKDAVLSVNAGSYTVTFEDPVRGDGALNVSGGEVKFLSAQNSLAGGLSVNSGTALIDGGFDAAAPLVVSAGGKVVLSGAQEFASIEGDGILSMKMVGGAAPSLFVVGTADLSGLEFEIDAALKAQLKEAKIDLIFAKKIVGVEDFAAKLRYEVVTENGMQVLKVRSKIGTAVVLR
jgi:hypothetical protein